MGYAIPQAAKAAVKDKRYNAETAMYANNDYQREGKERGLNKIEADAKNNRASGDGYTRTNPRRNGGGKEKIMAGDTMDVLNARLQSQHDLLSLSTLPRLAHHPIECPSAVPT